jgi:hypothetical protein
MRFKRASDKAFAIWMRSKSPTTPVV